MSFEKCLHRPALSSTGVPWGFEGKWTQTDLPWRIKIRSGPESISYESREMIKISYNTGWIHSNKSKNAPERPTIAWYPPPYTYPLAHPRQAIVERSEGSVLEAFRLVFQCFCIQSKHLFDQASFPFDLKEKQFLFKLGGWREIDCKL